MTKRTRSYLVISLALTGLAGLAACGSDSDSLASHKAPPAPPSAKQPVIEESDLYKVSGTTLFVQNPHTGLNVLDIAVPSKPRLIGRAPTGGGAGAEIYVRTAQAIVLLKTATSACLSPQNLDPSGWTFGAEVDFVDLSSYASPKLMARYCIPGTMVASRTVDDMLYLITAGSQGESRAVSIDISDPTHAVVVQQKDFPGKSRQISITAKQIIVAGESSTRPGDTAVQYISISNKGEITPRSEVHVPGQPQGRFHQDIFGDQFRIVTYNAAAGRSVLTLIDLSDPTSLQILGAIEDIGKGEKLYATRFTAGYAYVVTFRQTDPLWIVDLTDPKNPAVVGELHVPGWSDFIFPFEGKLITVGRGDNGGGLGVSLFDVSDPKNPTSISQITLGSSDTTSEANVDHRGVTIIDRPGQNPLVVVPHTLVKYASACEISDVLQLVEVTPTGLEVRGSVAQTGTIRRSLLVKTALYSISDHEILAIDLKDLNTPRIDTSVNVGQGQWQDPNRESYCSDYDPSYNYMGDDVWEDDGGGYPFMFRCDMGPGPAGDRLPLPSLSLLLGLLWLGRWAYRRR